MGADAATALWLTVCGGLLASLPLRRGSSNSRQGLPAAVALFSHAVLLALAFSFALHSRGLNGHDAADAFIHAVARQAETPSINAPPAASASPLPSPAPSPAAQPASGGGGGGTAGGGNEGAGSSESSKQPKFVKPTLEECRPAIIRMEVVLMLELLAEVVFVIVGWFILHARQLRKALKPWFITWRVIYLFPVAALNLSILWLGSAPTGSCLQYFDIVRLLCVHLMLYLLYNLAIVVLSFLASKTCAQLMGAKVDDNDCNGQRRGFPAADKNAPPVSNWGRGGGGVPDERTVDSAYTYEYAEEDPARCQFDCCGFFRFEP